MRDLTCTEVADSAPGFALDILEPQVRARVAAHLIRCSDCRRTVTEMEESAAELLDLDAGSAWDEPDWPPDYELPPVRPGRRRLRMVLTIAAAAALFVGTTFGSELSGHGTGQPIASAVLLAGDQAVGTVLFFAGHNPIIEVQADHLPTSGKLGVVLAYTDGSAARVGEIRVHAGRAVWVGAEPTKASGISSVMLVDSTLHQVAAASIH